MESGNALPRRDLSRIDFDVRRYQIEKEIVERKRFIPIPLVVIQISERRKRLHVARIVREFFRAFADDEASRLLFAARADTPCRCRAKHRNERNDDGRKNDCC